MVAPVAGRDRKFGQLEESCLGPVEVLATRRRAFDVKLPSGEQVEAELALAFPYKPVVGHILLG